MSDEGESGPEITRGKWVRFVGEGSPRMLVGRFAESDRGRSIAVCFWTYQKDMRCMEIPVEFLELDEDQD